MTGFCTTIDQIAGSVTDLVSRGIYGRADIAHIAAHICAEFGVTTGTATWITRHTLMRAHLQDYDSPKAAVG